MWIFSKKWWATLLILLAGCVGPQIYHGQLVALNLGMEPAQTIEKLGLPPLATKRVTVDGKDYLFHQYTLNNGLDLGNYFLAFENNQLKYWGYIDDFRRHPDSRLNRAIDQALSGSPGQGR